MGFLRQAAQVGTFGLAGLALSKKDKKPKPTLATQQPTGVSEGSLINSYQAPTRSLY